MLIILILILTIINVALKLSRMGIELSYQVGKRANAIRGRVVSTNKKDSFSKGKKLVSRLGKFSVRATERGIKATLRLLSFVVSLLRNILVFFAGFVIVLDIIVFLVVIAVVGAYLLLFQ